MAGSTREIGTLARLCGNASNKTFGPGATVHGVARCEAADGPGPDARGASRHRLLGGEGRPCAEAAVRRAMPRLSGSGRRPADGEAAVREVGRQAFRACGGSSHDRPAHATASLRVLPVPGQRFVDPPSVSSRGRRPAAWPSRASSYLSLTPSSCTGRIRAAPALPPRPRHGQSGMASPPPRQQAWGSSCLGGP